MVQTHSIPFSSHVSLIFLENEISGWNMKMNLGSLVPICLIPMHVLWISLTPLLLRINHLINDNVPLKVRSESMWFSQNKNLILSKTLTAIHDYNSCSQFNFIFGNSNIHVLFTVLNDDIPFPYTFLCLLWTIQCLGFWEKTQKHAFDLPLSR